MKMSVNFISFANRRKLSWGIMAAEWAKKRCLLNSKSWNKWKAILVTIVATLLATRHQCQKPLRVLRSRARAQISQYPSHSVWESLRRSTSRSISSSSSATSVIRVFMLSICLTAWITRIVQVRTASSKLTGYPISRCGLSVLRSLRLISTGHQK